MKTILLTAAAVAAVTGLAFAAAPAFHEMTVTAPDGGVAHIRYLGDTPPKVNFVRSDNAAIPAGFVAASPFAEMDQISAMMDRQMALMMLQARAMQAQAAQMEAPLYAARLQANPAAPGMFFASVPAGAGVCMRSVRITQSGNGAPQVISQQSGDCGGAGKASSSTAAPAELKAAPEQSTAPLQTISYKPANVSHPRQGI
jgi:hypothetical protein